MAKVPALLLAVGLAAASEGPPLNSVGAVRALPHGTAAEGLPVDIGGTVVFLDPKHSAIVFHDGKTSCWAGIKPPLPAGIKPGSKIRVTGSTNIRNGYFANIVEAHAEVLGQGELPPPIPITGGDLFLPQLDSQWVQVEATVVGTEGGGLGYTLALDIDGKIFKADVPFPDGAPERAAGLMQRRVKLSGICATVANDDRQLTDRHFLVPSFEQITPVDTAAQSAPPKPRKIAELLQSDNSPLDAVRVEGVVTQDRKGRFFLRDGTASTLVYTFGEVTYAPGTRVAVEGYAGVAPFRPVLRASKVGILGEGGIPAPLPLDPRSGFQPKLHNEFVEADCEFVGTVRAAPNRSVLQCRSGNTYFEAIWIKPDAPEAGPQPGDTIRIRGIYEVTTIFPLPRMEWVNGFRMHLQGADAVEVLKKAPWWTFERLLAALGIAIAAILAFLVWTSLLRRRVAAQTKIISSQVERATIRDERQRIARELHDTLEQDLTGLSMQLENAIEEIGNAGGPAHESLGLVHRMLRRCRTEARSSVTDLRDPKLIASPLPETMGESLAAKARETHTTLDFSTAGPPRTLRSTTQNHLLRIAREALNNAQIHGKASAFRCRLAYTGEGVDLELEDNGAGFDTSVPAPPGHFGLIGMRERANKIHAAFSLVSAPGGGTRIRVSLPYASPEALPHTSKTE